MKGSQEINRRENTIDWHSKSRQGPGSASWLDLSECAGGGRDRARVGDHLPAPGRRYLPGVYAIPCAEALQLEEDLFLLNCHTASSLVAINFVCPLPSPASLYGLKYAHITAEATRTRWNRSVHVNLHEAMPNTVHRSTMNWPCCRCCADEVLQRSS